MPTKTAERKSAARRPLADASNRTNRLPKPRRKAPTNSRGGEGCDSALKRLLAARTEFAGVLSQIDNVVAAVRHRDMIPANAIREIASLSDALSKTCSALMPWFPHIRDTLNCMNEFTDSPGTMLLNENSIFTNDGNFNDADLLAASPSPLVPGCSGVTRTMIGEKHLFLLTPLPKPSCPRSVTRCGREVPERLEWFLSPLKTCILMEPSDEEVQCVGGSGGELMMTPWNHLESSRVQGGERKHPGETTLKKELWTRFDAVTTGVIRLDKSVFAKTATARSGFLDMLEEAS